MSSDTNYADELLEIPGVLGAFIYANEKLIEFATTREYSKKNKRTMSDIEKLQKFINITKREIGFEPEIEKVFIEGSTFWGFLLMKYDMLLFCTTKKNVNEKVIFNKMDDVLDEIYISTA